MTEQDHSKLPRQEHDAHGSFEEGEEAAPPGVFVMAIVRWLLVLAMAIAAGASLFYVFGERGSAQGSKGAVSYYCPMHPSVVQDHPGECPICNMTLVPQEDGAGEESAPPPAAPSPTAPAAAHDGARHEASAPYVCPMHPEETGTSPEDRCSICGMKLELKAGGEAASAPAGEAPSAPRAHAAPPPGLVAIDLPKERVQLIGMRTARVRRDTLPTSLRAVGVIAPTEGAVSSVQTRFSGWIQELHVDETGTPVTRGQLLARIYSPELLVAQQEMVNAKKWTQSTEDEARGGQVSLLDDARSRLVLMGMDPAEVAEVERSSTPHPLIEVRSPARGYVADKRAVKGLFIQPGAELFRIADLSRVWVLVDVFERDAGRVHAGQEATLTLTAYPGESFQGKVTFVYPELSKETRTLRARVELKNPKAKLKPGMFGDVTLSVLGAEGLLIPREALVDMGEHQYVFVEEQAGHFVPKVVRAGMRTGDAVQILEGLDEGETVVTTGNFLLDSESRLRFTISGRKAPTSEHEH